MGTALVGAFGLMRTNMRNPVHRRNVMLLMTGKAIGLAIVFGLMRWLIPH